MINFFRWILFYFSKPKINQLNVRFVSKPGFIDSNGHQVVPDTSWFEFYVIQLTDDKKAYRVLQWHVPAKEFSNQREDWHVKVGEDVFGWTYDKKFKWEMQK